MMTILENELMRIRADRIRWKLFMLEDGLRLAAGALCLSPAMVKSATAGLALASVKIAGSLAEEAQLVAAVWSGAP